ncbi:predicted protein [Scheffersomyces stipitis CBS 6054]|uniref:Translation machinery-associated protein 64 n=1 Tax=Scheffersomyces stipitis (strain ATCC 58785 / CBS 6054 / NBRC 10063 / NRRL Y-11545) TaxID=322104 RepID=A3LZH4_PICST|nr:predicted protein [Scheffersomyces stipitis CBS 6054]ABN68159.2 predicted protein [Scheffersomyces stipitis CBS 6054]
MFKKDPQPKASANIKSSERRKLLQNICNVYGLVQDELAKEATVALLPNNTKQAAFKSVQGYSGTIYSDDNETPTWFKSRDSQIYPSLFTVWKCPYLLPTVKTHPHVIGVLEGGADLMLPGTIPPFDKRCVKGVVVGVVDSANPTVIKAIGRCKLNLTQFDTVVGRTGVAVEILHHIDDELYKLNKFVDIDIPEELDTKIPLKEAESELAPENEDNEEIAQENKDEIVPEPKETAVSQGTQSYNIDDVAEQVSSLTVEEVDNFFTRSLLQTIKLEDIELPIISSTFMSLYIYKNLPVIDSSYCNIKRTSWKKTSKFLKAMVKLKYLDVKGKDEDLTIIKLLDKKNPLVENFVPHKTMGKLNSASQGPTQSKKANELSVVSLYKPTNKSRMFFNKVDQVFNNYFTSSELRSLLEKYIKSENLSNPKNPKTIVLDDNLLSITGGERVSPRDQVFKAFLANFSPHYQINEPGASGKKGEVKRGQPPKILIITEMKIGRKVITRVSNFEDFYIKPHLLSEELKVKCSGSSTIGPYVQNPKITEVTVQGPHGKLIIEMLKEKGVPVTCIEFQDKVKKGKKR